MHEASIAMSILDIVLSRVHAQGAGAAAKCVTVECGEFRNVDPESLEFAFENLKVFSQETMNCQLQINVIRAEAVCVKCKQNYLPQPEQAFRCNFCGGGIRKLLKGEELSVTGVDVCTSFKSIAKESERSK